MTTFVAWDGEGLNDENPASWLYPQGLPEEERYAAKPQSYSLLMAKGGTDYPTRHEICEPNHPGLSTRESFDFLLTVGSLYPHAVHVIYSGNYDVNMMFKDIPLGLVKAIHEGGKTNRTVRVWHYQVKYLPRKLLYLKNTRSGQAITLWDVLGFFQHSFVKSMEAWLPAQDWQNLRKNIQNMKAQRGTFQAESWEDIKAYCEQELDALLAIMKEFHDALLEAKIKLKQWHGAGAIAGALFTSHHVPAGRAIVYPDAVSVAVQHAYAGGRIEACKFGLLEAPIYHYDINSAYPAAMADLPDLGKGHWERTTYTHWESNDKTPFRLCKVYWRFPLGEPWYPFFYRSRRSIYFPFTGCGWYWYPELKAAMEWAKMRGYAHGISVLDGYIFVPDSSEKPLAFVPEMYALRQAWVQEGKAAEKVLKLGLNSLYGKMAQQAGWRIKDGELKKPRYHNLAWAGYVTACTRAKLVTEAACVSDAIISFQTDGIYTTQPLRIAPDTQKTLGGWSADEREGIFQIQPGVYFVRSNGHWQEFSRGYEPGSIDRNEVLETYQKEWHASLTSLVYPARVKRFVGYGSILAGTPASQAYWRRFKTSARDLDLLPTGKRWSDLKTTGHPATGLVCSQPAYIREGRWVVAADCGGAADMPLSDPFLLDWEEAYNSARPIDGADPREVAQEAQDAYD